MQSDDSTISLDAVLEFIQRYVQNHADTKGTRVQGTNLAQAIRDEFKGFTYEKVGYQNLVGLIKVAEERRMIVRHKDVKHVEVSPSLETPRDPAVGHANKSSRISPEIWYAFVLVNQPREQYLDCVTGRVVAGPQPQVDGTGADESPRFVRIEPIPEEVQRSWMREFLTRHGLEDNAEGAEAAIGAQSWWLAFPQWLSGQSEEAAGRWRSYRTRKVIDYLKEWAAEHEVKISLLLLPWEADSRESVSVPPSMAGAALRRAIIAAVNELPLERLEEISVPFRYVLRHFEPRK